MTNIQSIHKAVKFIDNHLKEEIAVADVADAVYYSLFHFIRTFNKIIHHTPYDYIMRRRLSESARELIETDKKIIEIAFDYRFNNHETFSRAFKKMFGMQPIQWKKRKKLEHWSYMPGLSKEYIEHINGQLLNPVFEQKESFHLAGIMSLVNNNHEISEQLWDIFETEIKTRKEKIYNSKYYGVINYTNEGIRDEYFYLAGVEIDSPNLIDPNLIVKSIPTLKYARFIHKGSRDNLHLTLDYIYHTWLPKSGKSLSDSFVIENYGQEFGGAEFNAGEIQIYISI
jgi:AraC family transcriptional regulator